MVGERTLRDPSLCLHEELQVHRFPGALHRVRRPHVPRTVSGELLRSDDSRTADYFLTTPSCVCIYSSFARELEHFFFLVVYVG